MKWLSTENLTNVNLGIAKLAQSLYFCKTRNLSSSMLYKFPKKLFRKWLCKLLYSICINNEEGESN